MEEKSRIFNRVITMAVVFVMGITVLFGNLSMEAQAASKKPSKVTISSVKSSDYNAIKITWKKASNAKKYQVYRATSKNGKYKLVKTTTAKSYTNTGLTTGKKYYYKVRAINGSRKGSFSSKKYATPTLKQTTGLKATSGSATNVKLTWNKVNGAKGYKVYRATSKNGTYKLIKTTTAKNYTNTGLTTGKAYYYKVRAYRTVSGKNKYGSYSSKVSATPTIPKVTGLNASATSETSIKISWSKVSDAKGYKIYRATSKNGTYDLVKTTSSTSFTDNNLSMGKTYYYKVRAYREVSGSTKYGSYSNVVFCELANLDTIRENMLEKVNAERAKKGLAKLELYAPINETSQVKAKDLYITGVFDHYSENLGYFYDQYDELGITYYAGAENIAFGQSNVSSVMNSWMNSAGHKANILGDYTHLGVGYYKGYWVQQFVYLPDSGTSTGETIECPACGQGVSTDEKFTSKDYEGNVYDVYQCTYCYEIIEKCPKCEDGYFEAVGLTQHGSLAGKCNKCGHQQTEICIDKCPSCNAKVLGNTTNEQYCITFDSTQTYDGETYERSEGCYFQQFIVDANVCKSCGKYVRVDESDTYKEGLERLTNMFGEDVDLFGYKYIRWEKKVDTVPVEGEEGVYRQIYEFIDTPRIYELSELRGKESL